jgi:uncharacterized SAM-binding protein YcdF (DUF218 family)
MARYSKTRKIRLRSYIIGFILLISLAAILGRFYKRKLVIASRPNVILIILDAARADHFSCYGYGKNTTPRMDAIS